MEKIIVPVWKPQQSSTSDFKASLLGPLSTELLTDVDLHALKICIVDEHVAPAESYRMINLFTPPFDAVLIIWLDTVTAFNHRQSVLAPYVDKYYAYLVTESDQLPIDAGSLPRGEKTEGMNEMVFIQKPDRLEYDEWLEIWQGSHTQIAIDTQSTYGYRQNVVARKLTPEAPDFACIVEENFPEKAIHSRAGFYDADGNEELQKAREKEMVESCVRFIDFDKMDCIPMSEYLMK